jgi:alpha/beta superfamily hydrolase
MKETMVSFRSGQLLLEGALSTPTGKGPFPAVLVCHPHPSFGGSMDNSVVVSICQALFKKSIMSLRFNFRGVGRSEGHFSHGTGEQEDVKAAISFLVSEKLTDPGRLGLAGYSAGAVFGLPVAVADARVRAMAAVSLPLGMMDLDAVRTCPKPKMFISGSKDDFTSVSELNEFCQSCV